MTLYTQREAQMLAADNERLREQVNRLITDTREARVLTGDVMPANSMPPQRLTKIEHEQLDGRTVYHYSFEPDMEQGHLAFEALHGRQMEKGDGAFVLMMEIAGYVPLDVQPGDYFMPALVPYEPLPTPSFVPGGGVGAFLQALGLVPEGVKMMTVSQFMEEVAGVTYDQVTPEGETVARYGVKEPDPDLEALLAEEERIAERLRPGAYDKGGIGGERVEQEAEATDQGS